MLHSIREMERDLLYVTSNQRDGGRPLVCYIQSERWRETLIYYIQSERLRETSDMLHPIGEMEGDLWYVKFGQSEVTSIVPSFLNGKI